MNKMLISIIIILILILLSALGGLFWYLEKEKEPKTQVITKPLDPKDETLSDIGPLYPLKPFIVNLQTPDESDVYLKATLSLELDDKLLSHELDKKTAVVRNAIIEILSSYTQDVIMSQKGKDEVCIKIKNKLNSMLTDGQIRNVYIVSFIIQ